MTVEPMLANKGTNSGKLSQGRAKVCLLMRLR
jgi:hypothetical protein